MSTAKHSMGRRMGRGLLVLSLGLVAGCQFYARSPEDYRTATREVLETRSAQIKSCYDEALKSDTGAEGRVVVRFTVEAETGTFKNAEVDSSSTAPAELGQCIVQAVDGLTLDPPDQRVGDATFIWEFKKG